MRVAIRRPTQLDAALCFFFRSAATQAVTNKMQNCLCFVICIIAVYPHATRLGLQSWSMVLLRSTDQLISNIQINHWPRWCWLQHLSSRALLTSSNQQTGILDLFFQFSITKEALKVFMQLDLCGSWYWESLPDTAQCPPRHSSCLDLPNRRCSFHVSVNEATYVFSFFCKTRKVYKRNTFIDFWNFEQDE